MGLLGTSAAAKTMDAQPTQPEVSIEVPARAEEIGAVREEVGRCAERLGMSGRRIGDLKTIVSEAMNNVVVHAYDDGGGSVTVDVGMAATEMLEVVIKDHGRGIFPHPDADVPSLKMGLPIIGALSEGFRLESRRGAGTVLTVSVPIH
jgi:anti-sigma regulatory factor (Ser/Thr protein kinase)